MANVGAPGHAVNELPGSTGGQQFKGAGGHVMDNEGQILLETLAPLGDGTFNEADVTWQVTDVCRPLLSVRKVCDKGQHTDVRRHEGDRTRQPRKDSVHIPSKGKPLHRQDED